MSAGILGFICGMFFGGLATMICITALIVAKEADEREEMLRKRKYGDNNRENNCG